MKNINQFLATAKTMVTMHLAFVLAAFFSSPAHVYAGNGTHDVLARGGFIYYTLQIGDEVAVCDTVLTDDSYIYTDNNSYIAIADPCERFYVGVAQDGLFFQNTIRQATTAATANAYTLASFLVYDEQAKTMEVVPFDDGYVSVQVTDSGSYHIKFRYSLKQKATGKCVTLEGEARFFTPALAMH